MYSSILQSNCLSSYSLNHSSIHPIRYQVIKLAVHPFILSAICVSTVCPVNLPSLQSTVHLSSQLTIHLVIHPWSQLSTGPSREGGKWDNLSQALVMPGSLTDRIFIPFYTQYLLSFSRLVQVFCNRSHRNSIAPGRLNPMGNIDHLSCHSVNHPSTQSTHQVSCSWFILSAICASS
jgi:hypothetical protein